MIIYHAKHGYAIVEPVAGSEAALYRIYNRLKKMNKHKYLQLVIGIEALNLQYSSRNLLSKLISLIDDEGKITISGKDLVKLTNSAKPTITRAIKQLRDHNFLESSNNGNAGARGRASSTYIIKLHQIRLAIEASEKYMNLERDFTVA